MDFLDSGGGVVCSSDNTSHVLFTEDAETKQQNNKYGSSEFLKQERSSSSRTVTTTTEDDYTNKDSKLAKTSDGFSSSKANTTTTMMFQHQQQQNRDTTPLLRSNGNSNNNPLSDCQQMLSFSSPNNSQTVTMLPYYHHPPSNPFTRNSSGYGNGGMHGVVTGVRGPFTPSQWMELEHQALIYKYITANVHIPPYLLHPIRKALESAGFSTFSGLRPNSLGWGGFHLGLSNSSDPEPGRCRRTDGKKWRCSRDAVVDQKYCERHMNRGRHRSRKPVEPQTVNSVSATTTTTTSGGATSSKLMNISSSTSAAASPLVPGGATSNNTLGLSYHHQINPPETTPYLDRSFMSKENVGNTKGFSIVTPSAKDRQYSIPKEQSPYEETSRAEFGLVCDDSLINPLNKSSSLVSCRSYAKSQDINYQENKSQHHPLRQFMDDWPKNQSDQSSISSWPNIDWHSDRTQLSISIPVLTSGFVSSTSSPTNDKIAASPLSRELEATQMGLGIRNNIISEQNKRQGSWIPITWESTMGGPLGEVLHNTNSGLSNFKNTSDLNLMTEGWDRTSSPTGVLQKSSFGSLSNSSAGSSPRAENSKTNEGSSLCNGLLGMNPTLSAM